MFNGLIYPLPGDYKDSVELLNRSSCVALPRVIETWTNPPKFNEIAARIQEVEALTRRTFLYGMFIAEAISTTAVYMDENNQSFNFAAMCKPGTLGQWGANTCVPDIENSEFLRYLRFIIPRAMDVGVRDFIFGQLGHIDPNRQIGSFLQEIRQMASDRNVSIVIGGQPNGVPPESYLKTFDYIITPAYVDEDVSTKCLSRITSGCQAIYFHPELANLPNNVVVEMDWSGPHDDIHNLAKKPMAERRRYIAEKYAELLARNIGFVLPFRIIFDGGSTVQCKGFNQYVYSASQSFECKDEFTWNAILQGKDPTSTYNMTGSSAPVAQTPQTKSCTVGSTTLTHGSQRTFYSSTQAENCSLISQSRSCNNGVVSGSASYSSTTCTPVISLNTARAIATEAFISVMGRTSQEVQMDLEGLEYWAQRVRNGLSTAQLHAEMLNSLEYKLREIYLTSLNRRADLPGLLYFMDEVKGGRQTLTSIQNHFIVICNNRENGECSN